MPKTGVYMIYEYVHNILIFCTDTAFCVGEDVSSILFIYRGTDLKALVEQHIHFYSVLIV